MKKRVKNIEETINLGQRLGSILKPGMIITLEGQLGAGKTSFTKGIALGLGISRVVKSPTFTIVKEYMGGSMPLYHIDAYRLEGASEDIGFSEYFYGEGVTVIEWASFIEEFLPNKYLNIKINYISDNEREFVFETENAAYKSLVEELLC